VITFLVVTSIINLAAGYALAIYLRAGAWESTALSSNDAGSVAMQAAMAAAQPGAMSRPAVASAVFTAPPAASPAVPPQEPVPMRSSGASQPEGKGAEPTGQRSDMDQELLAGIEEFRNQLAQLKTKGSEEAPVVLGGV
jgi:hypothetical protein